MDLSLALKGVLIGLSVAAPIGPMSMLTMRRAIDRGLIAGLASGLGIALADATYGAIAAFGLTSLSDLLIDHQRLIRIAGGMALLYIAWRILQGARKPVVARPETSAHAGPGTCGRYDVLADDVQPNHDSLVRGDLRGIGTVRGVEQARLSTAGRQRLRRIDALVARPVRDSEPNQPSAHANLDHPRRLHGWRDHLRDGAHFDRRGFAVTGYDGCSSTLSKPEVASASITP